MHIVGRGPKDHYLLFFPSASPSPSLSPQPETAGPPEVVVLPTTKVFNVGLGILSTPRFQLAPSQLSDPKRFSGAANLGG